MFTTKIISVHKCHNKKHFKNIADLASGNSESHCFLDFLQPMKIIIPATTTVENITNSPITQIATINEFFMVFTWELGISNVGSGEINVADSLAINSGGVQLLFIPSVKK